MELMLAEVRYYINDHLEEHIMLGVSEVAAAMRSFMITLGTMVDRQLAHTGSLYTSSSNLSALNTTGILSAAKLLNIVEKGWTSTLRNHYMLSVT